MEWQGGGSFIDCIYCCKAMVVSVHYSLCHFATLPLFNSATLLPLQEAIFHREDDVAALCEFGVMADHDECVAALMRDLAQ